MSDTNPDSDSDSTLYNPPPDDREGFDLDEADQELEIEIPRDLADQLLEVAEHLGLNPSIVASRAVGLVCDEIRLLDKTEIDSTALIEKYQTRLDLLHSIDYDLQEEVAKEEEALEEEGAPEERAPEEEAPEEGKAEEEAGNEEEEFGDFGWDDVDQIIEQAEETKGKD